MGRIVLHDAAIKNLVNDSGVKSDMRRRGERVLAKAQESAPVVTGAYRDGLHLEEIDDGGVRVAGGSDHDIFVEADTGNLARALDAGGD